MLIFLWPYLSLNDVYKFYGRIETNLCSGVVRAAMSVMSRLKSSLQNPLLWYLGINPSEKAKQVYNKQMIHTLLLDVVPSDPDLAVVEVGLPGKTIPIPTSTYITKYIAAKPVIIIKIHNFHQVNF